MGFSQLRIGVKKSSEELFYQSNNTDKLPTIRTECRSACVQVENAIRGETA